MAIFVPRFVRQLRDVLLTAPADGEVLTYDSADEKWKNEAGSGGGGDITDAVILNPQISARNTFVGPGDVIRAIFKAHAAQSVDLTQWQLSSGALAWGLSKGGHEILADLAAPADGDVPTGQRWQWYDDSVGAPVLKFTQRDSAGTLFKGRALSSDYDTGAVRIAVVDGVAAIDYVLQLEIPDRDIITGNGYGPYFEASGERIWGIDAWGAMYLSGPFVALEIAKVAGDSSTKILQLNDTAVTFYGADADTTVLFQTDRTVDGLSFFGKTPAVGQQTAASVGDLWAALKALGLLDAGSTAPSVGGAPSGATYITQTPDAGLSAEQALSALATGLVKNTTGTGVLSIGAQGTDYYAPGGTDVAVADGGTGASTAAGARTNLGVIAANVPFTPAGTIAATDVQAAIEEVASEAGGGGISPTLFDANTVLAADTDDTPAALTMGASTILARLAAGNIKAASVSEIRTLLGITDPAMALLFDSTLGADAASIDITGISAAYKHLQIIASIRSTRAAQTTDTGNLRFNNDTAANYNTESVFGFGIAEDSVENLAATSIVIRDIPAVNTPGGYFAALTATIVNYSSATMRKTMNFQVAVLRDEATGLIGSLVGGGHWDSTAAIDRITLYAGIGNLLAGSRLTIYGLA